jgi:hypothetical protein
MRRILPELRSLFFHHLLPAGTFAIVFSALGWSFSHPLGIGLLIVNGIAVSLNVTAAVVMGSYLRHHRPPDAPYVYQGNANLVVFRQFFGIVPTDAPRFRALMQETRRGQALRPMRGWLHLNEYCWGILLSNLLPYLLYMCLFWAVGRLLSYLIGKGRPKPPVTGHA